MISENTRHVGMELAAFLLPEQRASLLRAEHKVNDDIGKGLGHWSDALTGLMMFVRLTWASARGARSSPGHHIRGFQPASMRMRSRANLSRLPKDWKMAVEDFRFICRNRPSSVISSIVCTGNHVM